jgi:hypothetical protein
VLTPTQQIDRLPHIHQALDAIVPALNEATCNGRYHLSIAIHAESREQIAFQMYEPAERSDAQGLATLLGWTEKGQQHYGGAIHYCWYGVLGGFRARLVIAIKQGMARDTQGRPPLPAGVGVGPRIPMVPAERLRQRRFRMDEYVQAPPPQPTPHEQGCTVAAPCDECKS